MDDVMIGRVRRQLKIVKLEVLFCEHDPKTACSQCLSRLSGNVSRLMGNVSGLTGDVSYFDGTDGAMINIKTAIYEGWR